MTDFANEIADGLTELREELGVAGTYTRVADGSTVPITYAVPAKTRNTEGGDWPFLDSTHQDFLIGADELVIGDPATQFEPVSGDTFACTLGGQALVFQALPADPDSPPWDWSDQGGHTQRRVHFKRHS